MNEGGRESALTLSAMLVSAPRLHSSSSTVEHPYIVHIITAVRPFCRTYKRRSSRGKGKGRGKKGKDKGEDEELGEEEGRTACIV